MRPVAQTIRDMVLLTINSSLILEERKNHSETEIILKRRVLYVAKTRGELLTNIILRYSNKGWTQRDILNSVAKEFHDIKDRTWVGWPNIVWFLAFVHHWVLFCKKSGLVENNKKILEDATNTILVRYGDWLRDYGSWEGMEIAFKVPTVNIKGQSLERILLFLSLSYIISDIILRFSNR